jgi:ribose-phosphate pyrophosphokinase
MAIDLHAQQIQGFFSIPMDEITALRILTKEFEDRSKAGTLDLANTVIVSPDIGAAKRARDMAGMLGIRRQFAIIDKRRDKETSEVTALAIIGDVAGKTAIVIDEEISTGGSMVEAARILKDRGGAKEVYAACTHAVFCGKVVENFDKLAGELADPTTNPSRFAFREIVVTDTLPLTEKQKPTMIPIKPVTIAPFLGDVIKCIHLGGSLGELLGDEHDRSD